MKLSLASLNLFLTLVTGLGATNVEPSLRSRAKPSARIHSRRLSEEDIQKIKEESMLNADAQLPVQFVSADRPEININGRIIGLDTLQEYSVRAPEFEVFFDGEAVEQTPGSKMYTGSDDGTLIFLVKSEKNHIEFVHIQDGLQETSMVSVGDDGMMVAIEQDDYDWETMEKLYHYDHVDVEEAHSTDSDTTIKQDDYDWETMERLYQYDHLDVEEAFSTENDTTHNVVNYSFRNSTPGATNSSLPPMNLATKAACGSIKTIDVAITFDSTFCARYGSSAAAQSRVESIVAMASRRYSSAPGLCTKLAISNIEGYCNRANDPYRNVVRNSNLLSIFRDYWNRNRRSRKRDTAHFFSGTDFSSDRSIGVAYVGTVCNIPSAYGINWMTFTSSLTSQALLFAHELGHNAGARHYLDRNTGHIMNPSINSGRNGFSSATVRSMNSYLGRQSCLARSGNEGTCGGGSRGNGRCADGRCCSRWGWCGTGSEYCSNGPSAGTCGGGSRGNGRCADGRCCSRWGWCGTGSEYCSNGPNAPSAGTCGGGSRGNGRCADGRCCSRWGWCGSGSAYCNL